MSTIVEHETAVQERLEPEARYQNIDAACRISLAISMKRIADEICVGPHTGGLAYSIRDAIETAIFNATRR